MHTLLILDPGHFHAALVLRESHPELSDDIHVYSPDGPDLERFLQMAESFNRRQSRPTRWRIHLKTGPDSRDRLLREKAGDIVVLAGKNHTKMETIALLHRAGFHVLADKPWVIADSTLPLLQTAMHSPQPLAADIMTERFEITTVLQKDFLAEESLFGRIRVDSDGSPSIFKESVHHLYKIVNNQPLVRPAWYFDTAVQGEGIMDVTTHLVDMTQWMLFPGVSIDFRRDIRLQAARRWATRVPIKTYARVTGEKRFPDSLRADVDDSVLNYYCNGELRYRIKDVPVHVRAVWNLTAPEGGGDTHRSLIKGTRADLMVRQLPERGFRVELLIVPRGDVGPIAAAASQCLSKWAGRYPGLALTREGDLLRVDIPDNLRTGHEEHFCQVRDTFLRHLSGGGIPEEDRAGMAAKYTLLAEARKLALASPFEPLKT